MSYRVLSRIWLAVGYMSCIYSASQRDKVRVHASSCTYYFLVSLVPLLIVTGFIVKNVLAGEMIMPLIEGLPFYFEAQQLLVSMSIPTPSLKAMGIFGALYGLWCASALLRGVTGAFTSIFGEESIRKSILLTIISYVFIPLFLISTIILASISSVVVDLINWLLADTLHLINRATMAALLTMLISSGFIVLGAYGAYMFLSTVRPKHYAAFTAAVLFVIYFMALQQGITMMTANLFQKYSVYGALGTILLILLWAFLVFLGLFIFAELASVLSKRPSAVYMRYIYSCIKPKPMLIERLFMNSMPFAYDKYVTKLKQGESLQINASMLLVQSGSVSLNDEKLVAGQFYLAPDGHTREITVLASENSGVIAVNEAEVAKLFSEFPNTWNLLKKL